MAAAADTVATTVATSDYDLCQDSADAVGLLAQYYDLGPTKQERASRYMGALEIGMRRLRAEGRPLGAATQVECIVAFLRDRCSLRGGPVR